MENKIKTDIIDAFLSVIDVIISYVANMVDFEARKLMNIQYENKAGIRTAPDAFAKKPKDPF